MKKILAIVLVLVFALSVMTVNSFAANKPLVLDFSREGSAALSNWEGTHIKLWGGETAGNSVFDAEVGAWKIDMTTKHSGEWQGTAANMALPEGWDDYEYVAIGYKFKDIPDISDDSQAGFNLCRQGYDQALEFKWNDGTSWSKQITTTENLITPGSADPMSVIRFCMNSRGGVATALLPGMTAYVQYVAFFATEQEANDFDFADWVSKNPVSAPESSTPESSAPESSAPEASKPSTDTGHATIISAAALMFGAAAAVVVLTSKKR